MSAQRIGAEQTHQDAGHREESHLKPYQSADRQSEPQDARYLGEHAEGQPDRHLRRHRQHAASEAEEHQPLNERSRAT